MTKTTKTTAAKAKTTAKPAVTKKAASAAVAAKAVSVKAKAKTAKTEVVDVDGPVQLGNELFTAAVNYKMGQTTFYDMDGTCLFNSACVNKELFPLLLSAYKTGYDDGNRVGAITGRTKLQNELKDLLAI